MKNSFQKHEVTTDAMGRSARQNIVEVVENAKETADSTVRATVHTPEPQTSVSIADIREKLAESQGKSYWRNLEELAQTPEFDRVIEQEFPKHAASVDGVDRRSFLKLSGASLALAGLAACTKQPTERIVPYVHPPEDIVPGKPQFYATAFSMGGYGYGALAESHMGRPTKVEGNPEHPASLGGSDIHAQASVLDLYDPDRSQNVLRKGVLSSWSAFLDEIGEVLSAQTAVQGAGVRILSETITSPTASALLKQFLTDYPAAKWVQYDANTGDSARAGAQAAFGEYVETIYDFSAADVVVSLDADFLYSGPGHVRYARDFADRRDVSKGADALNRLYAVETLPSVTGLSADHRLALNPGDVQKFARSLAQALGVNAKGATLDHHNEWLKAVADDLKAHQGHAVVVAGDEQSAEVHALAHAINAAIGAVGTSVSYIEPVDAKPMDQGAALAELVADMDGGKVDTLFIVGGNPVYNTPGNIDFRAAMDNVHTRVHLGPYTDETAWLCHWQIPEAHYLESWGDVRAYDGTVSIVQPLIKPLYEGRSLVEFLAVLNGEGTKSGYDLVQRQWEGTLTGDFGISWRRALHDGIVPDSAAKVVSPSLSLNITPSDDPDGLQVVIRPHATVLDGRFNNNGWLQELAHPVTKVTWENVISLSPATAERLNLKRGDVAALRAGTSKDAWVEGPIWVLAGQADETVGIQLGYGRTRSGRVGTDIGYDAYAIRNSASPWTISNAVLRGPIGSTTVAATYDHQLIEDMGGEEAASNRNLIRITTKDDFAHHPDFAQHPHMEHPPKPEDTLYPDWDYSKDQQWGMVIDLNRCNGCNACVVACQSENNIPVVGKEEVANGREMAWMRVDRYFETDGDLDEARSHTQPVNCMHCENAPCEPVCPVGATVHSSDGLNQMVYNRCVGTRYCANNCPYKVRRFNYFQYSDEETESLKLGRNPDVTVRSRGVMEKCTYCVQRISTARIDAKVAGQKAGNEDYTIADGVVRTACQQACPAGAIVFGDINDENSAVAKAKASDLNYGTLSDLNTRPRTTYLAKVTNPNPALMGEAAGDSHAAGGHH